MRVAILSLLVAVASCADGRSILHVTVEATGTVSNVDHLNVVVTKSGNQMSKPIDVKVAGAGTIPPAVDFALVLPSTVSGTITVVVSAQSASNMPQATAMGSIDVKPSGTTSISITLTGSAVTDMAPPPDDAMVDLASVDLAGSDLSLVDMDHPADMTSTNVTLTVTKSGNPKGLVAGSGITCGATCSTTVPNGTNVTLTASSPAGSAAWFTGWSGACVGSIQPVCTFKLTGNTTVTATFATANYVFVTSPNGANASSIKTPLGASAATALSAADAFCNGRASNAGLPGTYVAYLSTAATSAISRLSGARGWIRPDGKPVFDQVNLTSGSSGFAKMFYPIRVDETGAEYTTYLPVATGTGGDGKIQGTSNCADWQATTGSAASASATNEGTEWSYMNFGATCGSPMLLYCFGTTKSTPITPPPTTGRIIFTSTGWDPTTGPVAANTLCMSNAQANNLPGSAVADSYRALLTYPSPSTTVTQHLAPTGTGPWVRPDGIPVVATAADLFTAKALLATANQRADLSYADNGVWTGVGLNNDPTVVGTAANSCTNWTAPSTHTGTIGLGTDSSMLWSTGGGPYGCANDGVTGVLCAQR